MRKSFLVFFIFCFFIFFHNSKLEEEKNNKYINDILKEKIILISPNKKKIWVTNYKNMGIRPHLKNNKYLYFTIDEIIATYEILRLTKSLKKSPRNAELIVLPNNKILIKPDIKGVDIDTNTMVKNLKEKLELQGPISIDIVTKKLSAEITKKDIQNLKIEGLLAQFTTWFNPEKKNRTKNILLAAKVLDNQLIPPQKEFSFNKIIGPRTKEAGYNEAPIIFNNKFVQGIGGGVCQVSSTLYNVIIRTDLIITERHPHSLLVNYVPKGLDAAVVYGFKDFKFINNTKGYLLIKTYSGKNNLTIKLFGPKERNFNAEVISIIEKRISPKVIIKQDTKLKKSQVFVEQEGVEGYIVRVEKIIKDEKGKLVKHEVVSRDYYPPVDKIVRIPLVKFR